MLIATILGRRKISLKMSPPQDITFWGSVGPHCLLKDLAVKHLICTNKRFDFILTLTLHTPDKAASGRLRDLPQSLTLTCQVRWFLRS